MKLGPHQDSQRHVSGRPTSLKRCGRENSLARTLIDTVRPAAHRQDVGARHLFVCTNPRASGKPACGAHGGDAFAAEVLRRLIERGATDVLVTPCGCLGPCFDGPSAVVYPDGVWYGALTLDDAPTLVDHLIDGTVLAAKVLERPGS